MFRLCGAFMVVVSSFAMFYVNTIRYYVTANFVLQSLEFLKLMQFACNTGSTYMQALEVDRDKMPPHYKNFAFQNSDVFFRNKCKGLIAPQAVYKIQNIISGLGKRDLYNETGYIESGIKLQSELLEYYKNKHIESRKINRLCGISIGLIIVIVII